MNDFALYHRLLRYTFPYWPFLLVCVAGYIVLGGANVLGVEILQYTLNSISEFSAAHARGETPQPGAWSQASGIADRALIPIAFILTIGVRGLGNFIGGFCISYVGSRVAHTLRRQMFAHMVHLPSSFFTNDDFATIVSRITYTAQQVVSATTTAFKTVLREGVTIIGLLAWMLYQNWRLTMILIAVMPCLVLLMRLANRKFRIFARRIQLAMADITRVTHEAVHGYKEVRIFGAQELQKRKFAAANDKNFRQQIKSALISSLSSPVVHILLTAALSVLIWAALDPDVFVNTRSGNLIAFVTAAGIMSKPFRELAKVLAVIQRGQAASEDIFKMLDEPQEDMGGGYAPEKIRGEIEYRNLSFAYKNANYVLKDIDLHIHPGETVAIVGRSGSGKSTLVSLLSRLHDPQEGQILLDGHDLREYNLERLRSFIAPVSQDVALFNGSIAENIAYGNMHASSEAEIRKAAKKAHALDFIEHLAASFKTPVDTAGSTFSGGQKQRLSIARAVLKDAPILILDEATSALDSESEHHVQEAVEKLMQGRTTLIIAHRLSTVERADRILAMDNGTLAEEGTHDVLLRKNGVYAQLYRHQLRKPASESRKLVARKRKRKALPRLPEERLQILPAAWHRGAFWLMALTPLSWLFRVVSLYRRHRQTSAQKPFRVPVIVVGNLVSGGTGKTSLVIALASRLRDLEFRPGIVIRGYGGRPGKKPILAHPDSNPAIVGDEAPMIADRTRCPVAVHPNRVAAVELLLADTNLDVVISDDGLQHYRMHRDMEIVTINGALGFGNERLLPAGPLREPIGRLEQCDFVIVTGGASMADVPSLVPRYQMQLSPLAWVDICTGARQPPEYFAGRSVQAIAALAVPQSFFNLLRSLGIDARERSFSDHRFFQQHELELGEEDAMLMTEKDAVKVRHALPEQVAGKYWFLEIEARPEEAFLQAFDARLQQILARSTGTEEKLAPDSRAYPAHVRANIK